LTDTRYGKMLYNKNDIIIGKSLELYGEWYQSEMELMKPFISPGSTCIDIGAHIGAHTLFFAQAVGPKGTVIAFEPQLAMFQLLCANVALNDHLNVLTINTALFNKSCTELLPKLNYRKKGNFGAVGFVASGGYPVKVKALDNYAFPAVNLIKIDVEGVEKFVIEGARATIQRHQPLIYAENHNKVLEKELIALLKSLDYVVYQHLASAFNPHNFKKNARNIHADFQESSIFCVPKSRNLALDLKTL